MKARLPIIFFTIAMLARADDPPAPLYEETFNAASKQIELRNGAVLGAPGSGVSGKTDDLAYVSAPKSTAQERNGPAALAIKPIAPGSLSAFTCTFWYYLDEQGPDLQVPLSTASVLFLLQPKGFEIRIENQSEEPRAYVFTPGLNGPLAGWRDRGRWIFACFSWNHKTNTLVVHQGTPKNAVTFMREMVRAGKATNSLPRLDLAKTPETIGNTYRTLERPLSGRMDNLRFFQDRVLTRDELEAIRTADLANEPVKFN